MKNFFFLSLSLYPISCVDYHCNTAVVYRTLELRHERCRQTVKHITTLTDLLLIYIFALQMILIALRYYKKSAPGAHSTNDFEKFQRSGAISSPERYRGAQRQVSVDICSFASGFRRR